MISQNFKIDICKKTRKIAKDTLLKTLKDVLSSNKRTSEADLRDLWLNEMRKNSNLFSDGWYIPPPHGLIVLFGSDKKVERLDLKSARPKNMWPKKNTFLDRENGLISVYASPIDRSSGIIGDFGLTIYLGKKKKIQDHLRNVFDINKKGFSKIKIGMKLSDVSKFYLEITSKKRLVNDVSSLSDPMGTNIGHSIPGVYDKWTQREKGKFKKGKSTDVANTISKKRFYVNDSSKVKIQPGLAFTIEARL